MVCLSDYGARVLPDRNVGRDLHTVVAHAYLLAQRERVYIRLRRATTYVLRNEFPTSWMSCTWPRPKTIRRPPVSTSAVYKYGVRVTNDMHWMVLQLVAIPLSGSLLAQMSPRCQSLHEMRPKAPPRQPDRQGLFREDRPRCASYVVDRRNNSFSSRA